MALNTLFPRQKELVNYDYFDIAEGVGYVVYYGLKGNDGEYLLSTNSSIYSEEICIAIDQSVATTATKYFDFDFDLTFNRPKNIKGVIMANIPIGMSAKPGAGASFEFYAIVKAYHYDSSTETLLATGTSRTVVVTTLDDDAREHHSMIAACRMDVTALRHFKKGEILRFTVEGWFKTTEASAKNSYLLIGHDPKNRQYKEGTSAGTTLVNIAFANELNSGGTVTYQNTQMIFHVPFVLDI